MIRTFGYVKLANGGTPQPVFGTTLGAASLPGSQVNLQVADSSFFQTGDFINIDSGASEERTLVFIVPDSTHVTVEKLSKAHASGVFARLAVSASAVHIQGKDGNSGDTFIGTKYNMAKTGAVFCIHKLAKVAADAQGPSFDSTIAGFPGPLNSGEFWFDGTTNDYILPSFAVD